MLNSSDWGLDPNKARKMSGYPKMDLNYWNYKDVWYCSFYYENPQKKHTWFFRISPEFAKSEISNLSIHWWIRFSTDPIILPNKIYNIKTLILI